MTLEGLHAFLSSISETAARCCSKPLIRHTRLATSYSDPRLPGRYYTKV
jgi:hypothetical protein